MSPVFSIRAVRLLGIFQCHTRRDSVYRCLALALPFGQFKHLIEGHHAWPQYLGGPVRQELVKMPTWLHRKYHTLLDDIAPRGKGKEYFDNLSKEARAKLDKQFEDLTKEFDLLHGTKLCEAVLKNGFPNQ